MQCARVQLRERCKREVKRPSPPGTKPRRYCQKRMVDPDRNELSSAHDMHRFHCQPFVTFENEPKYNRPNHRLQHEDDLYLTVQNLKFLGDVQERKRPRTSFKYRSLSENRIHRMFVKEIVENQPPTYEEDRSSELASNYFDDYVKYILNSERSRPSSGGSSIMLQDISNDFLDKSLDDLKNNINVRKKYRNDNKYADVETEKNFSKEVIKDSQDMEDAKIAFHKTGKRRSLTISRAPSPETIQIIRVDVVCNYSTPSDYEDKKNAKSNLLTLSVKELDAMHFKEPHFTDKYLLTNTVKSVDENLTCGSKVTLLCKTFKMSDRAKSRRKASKNKKAN